MLVRLKPKKITMKILDEMHKNNLIKLFLPTEKIENNLNADIVEELYASDVKYGSHKLICVRKNTSVIQLTTHPENEEVIFLDRKNRRFKPLFLIIATCENAEFEKKAALGEITEADVLALEVEYNNALMSSFTILKDIPHCEVTISGAGEAPIFYVTEPTDMTMDYTKVKEYEFQLTI